MRSPWINPLLFNATIALLVISCSRNAYEQPIDSDIIVHVEEREQAYVLVAETEKEYGCVNYPIKYSYRRVGQKIKVKFKYIEEIDACLTAIGPARCEIDLGFEELDPDTEYELELKLNRKTNYGSLLLSDPNRITLNNNSNIRTKD